MNRAALLVLAMVPPPLQARLDDLRRAHYPASRNRVPAHVTLFHNIPGMVGAELADLLAGLTATLPAPKARIGDVLDLDGGTAIGVISPDLMALREDIADRFHGLLSGADTVTPRLHATVQNKVERRAAHILQAELAATWDPQVVTIPGLAVHRVIDGDWHPFGTWRFRGRAR